MNNGCKIRKYSLKPTIFDQLVLKFVPLSLFA